jgi:EpsG family
MYKQFRENIFIWVIFFLSPIISLFVALRNYRAPWVKNVAWAFIIFYGVNFFIYDELMDANRYAEKLKNLHETEITTDNFLDLFFSDEESSYLDFAAPVTTFLISRFTDNYAILFGTYALIFGFFYSRNIWFLLDRMDENLRPASLILFIMICLVVPFWSINGFRFWTATQVFIYGMLPYIFLEKRTKYLLMASSAVFFHFSFIIPLGIVYFSYTYTKNLTVLFYAFLCSFFFSFVQLQSLQEFLLNHAPEFLHKKLTTYVNQSYADNLQEAETGTKWFILLKAQVIKCFAFFIIIFSFVFHRNFISSKPTLLNSFCMILYLLIGFNILSAIPAFGRFLLPSYYLTFCFAFLLVQNYSDHFIWLKRVVYIATPLLAVYVAYTFRIGLQTINVLVITGNPILCIGEQGRSMLDWFKK